MFIKTLKCSNVRSVTGHWDIGPAVMIVGDNFRGKSALLHAIRLGIFGWIPHPRKDAEMSPMRLASADNMNVSLVLNDDRKITRGWLRDAKGSVSSTGVKDVDPLAPAIMVDPKQYFDASPAKRMQYVFSSVRLPESDFSMAAVLAEVKNITLEQNTEQSEEALKVVAKTFTDSIAEAEREALNVQDWVEHILATCSEKQKLAKQSVDRMGKTVAGLTELELRRPEQFDEDIGEIDVSLAYKRDELAKWNSERGRVEGELKTITQRMQQRDTAQRTLAGEAKLLQDMATNDDGKVICEKVIETPMHNFETEKTALVARRTAAKKEYDAIMERIGKLKDDISNAREAISAANNAKSNAEQQSREVDAEMVESLKSECCPTCDAPGQEWRERVKKKFMDKVLVFSNTIAAAQDTAVKHGDTKTKLEQQLATEQAAAKEADEKVSAIETEQRQLVQSESETKMARQRAESTLQNCVTRAESYAKEVARIAEAKQYLADTSVESDVSLRTDAANIAMKISNLSTEIGTLDVQRTQIVANKSTAANQLQAVREREKAQAELDIWKETIKVVTAFQRKMVDAAFGSMMGVANQFADGILASPLEYVDGEVGRRRDGRFVPHDQFSDAEQIITYAAMSIALAASAPFKVVIVDELTRVRGERKAQILERMIELVERGVIDQFFGVDTETDDGQVPEYYKHEKVDIIHIK